MARPAARKKRRNRMCKIKPCVMLLIKLNLSKTIFALQRGERRYAFSHFWWVFETGNCIWSTVVITCNRNANVNGIVNYRKCSNSNARGRRGRRVFDKATRHVGQERVAAEKWVSLLSKLIRPNNSFVNFRQLLLEFWQRERGRNGKKDPCRD